MGSGLATSTQPTTSTSYSMPQFMEGLEVTVQTSVPDLVSINALGNRFGATPIPDTDVGVNKRQAGFLIDRIRYIDRIAQKVHGTVLSETDLSHVYKFICQLDTELALPMDLEPTLLTTKANLVLNLSSINLTESQVSLLMKGVQFGQVGHQPRIRACARATTAVNDFISRLTDRLLCAVMKNLGTRLVFLLIVILILSRVSLLIVTVPFYVRLRALSDGP